VVPTHGTTLLLPLEGLRAYMRTLTIARAIVETFLKETGRGIKEYLRDSAQKEDAAVQEKRAHGAAVDIFKRFDVLVNRMGMMGALEVIENHVRGAREELMRATTGSGGGGGSSRVNGALMKFYLGGILTSAALLETMVDLGGSKGKVVERNGEDVVPAVSSDKGPLVEYRRGGSVGAKPLVSENETDAEREMRARSSHNIKNLVDVDVVTDEEFMAMIAGMGSKLPQA
jgi:hypothetical protein